MAGPVHCECGAILVDEATETGVKPVGSDEAIVFRRSTDYVICPSCFTVYSARALLAGSTLEESRVPQEEEDELARLERLAEQAQRDDE